MISMKLSTITLTLIVALSFVFIGAYLPESSTPKQTHRYIVQLDSYKSKDKDALKLDWLSGSDQVKLKSIFPSLSIYSLVIHTELSTPKVEKNLSLHKGIITFHPDAKTTLRETVPNDIDFSEQWNLDLISAPEAWDKTVGGKTKSGHDIVIAIIDNGFDLQHEDLVENIWINEQEIPDNNIDDDDNGFIDDYRGVNTKQGNGNVQSRTHGTGVAGIIGAKGNNRLGITGINWDIKMMLISGQAFVADIIESYNYALSQRKLFNETNGEEGALVVATNFSSGIDEAFAEEYPIWCQVYNELGVEGILNITAAPNNGKDIDLVGDMPSTCPSEFLIVVNNIDRNEILASDSGFGEKFVDIAAPGDEAFSLSIENSYNEFSGTSSSSPHVAGAVGLMYSVDRSALGNQIINKPSETAIAIKNALFDGATFKENLVTKNAISGRLNLAGAIDEIEKFYDNDSNFGLTLFPNPVTNGRITYSYFVDELTTHNVEIYDVMGRRVYHSDFQATSFDTHIDEIELGNNYSQGIYHLSVINENKILTKSFFIP